MECVQRRKKKKKTQTSKQPEHARKLMDGTENESITFTVCKIRDMSVGEMRLKNISSCK